MSRELKSKYQIKNYEEIEYELEEQVCPKCDLPFMMDMRYCKTVVEDDEDWAVKICPYCGHKYYICI